MDLLALLSKQKPLGSLCFLFIWLNGTEIELVSGPDPIDKQPLKKIGRTIAPNIFVKFAKTKAPVSLIVYSIFYLEKTVGLFLFCIMLFFSLAIVIIKKKTGI